MNLAQRMARLRVAPPGNSRSEARLMERMKNLAVAPSPQPLGGETPLRCEAQMPEDHTQLRHGMQCGLLRGCNRIYRSTSRAWYM